MLRFYNRLDETKRGEVSGTHSLCIVNEADDAYLSFVNKDSYYLKEICRSKFSLPTYAEYLGAQLIHCNVAEDSISWPFIIRSRERDNECVFVFFS